MSTIQVIFSILLMLASLVMIVSVLLQKGDADAMSSLTGGGSSSYFGKNKSKTMQGRLAAATKGASIVFVVLCLVMIFVK